MWDQKFDMKAKNVISEAIDHCFTDVNQIYTEVKGDNAYNNLVKNLSKNV